jgi:hypothetical protein
MVFNKLVGIIADFYVYCGLVSNYVMIYRRWIITNEENRWLIFQKSRVPFHGYVIMTKEGQKELPKNYYQKRLAIRPYINDIICFMPIPGHSGHHNRIVVQVFLLVLLSYNEKLTPSSPANCDRLQRIVGRLFSRFNQISVNEFVDNAGHVSLIGQAFFDCLFL